jgi:hypothetical protein
MARRRYDVIGAVAVLGTPPGGTFTAELDPAQEQRLLAAGSIRYSADARKDAPADKATQEDDE